MSATDAAAQTSSSGTLAFLVYRSAAGLLGALPRPLALAAAAGAGRLGAALAPKRRAVVAENLAHVCPDLDPAALDRLVRRSFASYGRYWAEVAKLTPRAIRRTLRELQVQGREHIDKALADGRGVIFAVPHLGFWEIGGPWAAREGFPLVTVAEAASSERLSRYFERRRSAMGLQMLPLDARTSVTLLATLRRGGSIALVADRDVVGDGAELPFFGAPAKIPLGPALLALRSGAALIPSAIYQDRRGYRAVFRPALDTERRGHLREDVERVSMALLGEFERLIATAPEQWHVFQPEWRSEPTEVVCGR